MEESVVIVVTHTKRLLHIFHFKRTPNNKVVFTYCTQAYNSNLLSSPSRVEDQRVATTDVAILTHHLFWIKINTKYTF